ncbi:hypothetical protein RI367_000728 [Sorochytrium milnesiophthora]
MDCQTDVCKAMLSYVVPIAGNITAVMTVASPLSAVLKVRRTRTLGDINPIPYAFIFANALVWIVYGFLVKDYFITGPNLIGVLLGLFYMHSAYVYASDKQRMGIDAVSIGLTFVIFVGGMVANITVSHDTGRMIMGVLSIVVLALFYSSPLSDFYKVLKTRNSVYFYLPLAVTCLANGVLWSIYGFVIRDFFVWGPNLLGACVAALQVLCRVLIPARVPEFTSEAAAPVLHEAPRASEESINERKPIVRPDSHA